MTCILLRNVRKPMTIIRRGCRDDSVGEHFMCKWRTPCFSSRQLGSARLACNPTNGDMGRDRRTLEAVTPARLSYLVTFQASEGPCLKPKWNVSEE